MSSIRSIGLATLVALGAAGAWVWLAAGEGPEAAEAGAGARAPAAAQPTSELPRFDAALPPGQAIEVTEAAPAGLGAPGAAADTAAAPLEALARLVGRVTRRDGGEPVAGIPIEVLCDPPAEPVAGQTIARTDADGRYRFAYAGPTGVYTIRLGSSPDTRGALRELHLELQPGAEVVQDFEVVAGATVSGRAIDRDGQPVPGARVRGWNIPAFRLDDRFPMLSPDQEVVADAAGEFRIGGLGPSFTLAADAAGLTGLEQLTGELASGAEVEGLTLTLGAARDLRGVVLAGHEPVAECRLDLEPAGAGQGDGDGDGDGTRLEPAGVPGVFRAPPQGVRAFSDASGAFTLPGLADRPYRVHAWHNHYVPWEGRHAPGDPDIEVQLAAGTRLTGELVSSRGGPVAGAEVTIGTLVDGPWPRALHQVRSDDEGRFEATGLAPDEQGALLVQGEGHAIHVEHPLVITEDGPNHVRVVLEPARALAGHVVDEAGQPLAERLVHIEGDRLLPAPDGMTVTPLPTWEGQFQGVNVTRTDAQGAFRLDSLYDGMFEVQVDDPHGQGVISRTAARSGSEDLRIVVGAASGVTLVGTVRDAVTGAPVEVFDVVPMTSSGAGGMIGDSYPFEDVTGAFRVTGLRPGLVALWLHAEGYSDLRVPQRHYAEGEHRLDLTMSAERMLSLRVLDDDKEPVEEARLTFLDADGEMLWVKSSPNSSVTQLETDEAGKAVAMGLPAGPVTVRVRTGHFSRSHDFPFDLRHELRGTQVLVLGDEGDETTVLVFFFGGDGAGLDVASQGLEPAMQELKRRIDAGSVWPLKVPTAVRALAADGQVLAAQTVDPATADAAALPIAGVDGICYVKLSVPSSPLELEALAEGYAPARRAWQPDRSSDEDEVVILLLKPD